MVLCIDHIKHLCFSDVDDVDNLNDDDSSDSGDENDQMQDLPPKKKKCTYRWRKNNPPVHDITFKKCFIPLVQWEMSLRNSK